MKIDARTRGLALTALAALVIGLNLPGAAHACVSRTESPLQVRQWVPRADLSTAHWPAQRNIVMGSVLSVLVPKEATVEIQALAKGMMEPVETVSDEALKRAAARIEYPEGAQRVEVDARKHRWVHLHASSFGKSRVVFKGPQGWTHALTLGVVYPTDQPQGEPLALEKPGQESPFLLSASSPHIWISVPGQVGDGWRLDGGKEVGLSLARVEQLEVPYGDAARVAVFLRGQRSIQGGSVVLTSTGGSAAAFPLRIQTRPTPAC